MNAPPPPALRLLRRLSRRMDPLFLVVLAALTLAGAPGLAHDDPAKTGEAAAAPAPVDKGPVAIPIASIAVQASNLQSFVKSIEASFAEPDRQAAIAETLPETEKDIRARAKRLDSILSQTYDRGELDAAQASWRSIQAGLDLWESTLAARLATLDASRRELSERTAVWQKTADALREQRAPGEVREVVSQSQALLGKAERALRKSRDEALGLQRSVVSLRSRAQNQVDDIATARDEVLRHVLRRNQPLPWEIEFKSFEANRESFAITLEEARKQLASYWEKYAEKFVLHGLLILALTWAALRVRRSLLRGEESDAAELPAALHHPVAAAGVLGLTTTIWIHPHAPPQLGQIATLIVLPFWYPVLRQLLPKSLRGPLIGFLLLVPLDLLRQLAVNFEVLSRGLLVLETLVYFAGIFWLRRPARLGSVPLTASPVWTKALGAWLHFALFASGAAVLGAAAGWTTLADLAVSAVARGSFAASILFTAVRVIEDLAEGAVRARQLHRVRTIDLAPETFLRMVRRSTRSIATVTWIYLVLEYLAVRSPVLEFLRDALATPLGYGNVQVTFGGVVAFGLAIWISWLLSRLIAAMLEGEVFSRVALPRGVPFALATISRYVVLVLGFVIAIAALGVEVGNLALLVSALGVGIGFGMQNIVNNFISGLILLFERPIKVGDRVSLDPLLGEVKQIGIRASVVRTFDGADVIVPNGDLISNQVTNWTLADSRRRVILPVGVTYGTPARDVIELLLRVANANGDVLHDPEPIAIFTGFGDSSLDFELRAWTDSEDALTLVRSALAVAIQDALRDANIEVPFPQRDLHLKTLPGGDGPQED